MNKYNDIKEALRWSPGLSVTSPIYPNDIEGFSKWVKYGKFVDDCVSSYDNHFGHDFILYLDKQGVEHYSLDSGTPVRAIADGVVKSFEIDDTSSLFENNDNVFDYALFMVVEHNDFGLASGYCHIVPQVDIGDEVKKGQQIATLYDTFPLPSVVLPIHLHLELGNSKILNKRYPFLNELIDPLEIIPGLKEITVSNQVHPVLLSQR